MTTRSRAKNAHGISRLGLALAAAYLGIALIAGAYVVYKLTFDVVHSELSGAPLIFVGLPWSLLVLELADGRFQGVGPFFALVGPCVLLNAGLIYVVAGKVESDAASKAVGGQP